MLDTLLHIDASAREWIVTHRVIWLNGALWLLSAVTRGGMLFLAIAAIAALVRRRASTFITVAIAIAIATLVADHVLKPLVQRRRPFVVAPAAHVIGGKPDDPSWPSGHAANAVAGALTLSRVVPQAAPVWWGLAVAVAYSRVYLGVHYPADVVGGAIVGLCSGFASVAIVGLARRRSTR
jgi:undecaprenyl-diphosphatase